MFRKEPVVYWLLSLYYHEGGDNVTDMEITPPFGEQEAARAAEMEHDHSDADVLASAAGHFNHGHPVLRV